MLIKSVSSTKVSFISVLNFLNGAQFLNITCVASVLDVAVIFPVTKIYASEKSQRLDSIDLVKKFISSFCEYLPFDSLSIIYLFFFCYKS